MLKDKNIICISSIDWDFIWQGHQEVMSTFARNGNRVIFIENTGVRTPTFKDIPRLKKRVINWFRSVKGFRREMDNLFVYSPIVFPFPYSKIARWINKRLLLEPLKRWMKAMDFHDVIIWTFLPTGIALDIVNEFDAKLLVYYYIADFGALADKPAKLKKTEDALIERCDLIFAQSEALEKKCRKLNPNVHIFPFGVNTKVFDDFLNLKVKDVPHDLTNVKGPIVGYIGGIHKHVDLLLIKYIAEMHRDWSIVLVGPKQTNVSQLDNVQNILFLGKKDFAELPAYIYRFDACIIPYEVSNYTKTVYPTKLNEYLIMGKPVVSTYLPEVKAFNDANSDLVALAKTREEFESMLVKALSGSDRKSEMERMDSARKSEWAERIEKMNVLMEKAIESKKKVPLTNWQERFLLLYKNTRTATVKLLAAAIVLWFLIFYTPIIWILAEPLKIAQEPQKADAIVVLAGGVGESGKAGQGYEERVGYAVGLYKEGYAPHLIFSSGYKYFYNETLLMKALAVALGVPESAIILEDKAKNTYENVIFTDEVLNKEKWSKILLVSSPYHIRRVSMVFSKAAGNIKVTYTPVPDSSFYSHRGKGFFDEKVNLQQIKGIAHEYFGIIYYWWKGWI